MERRKMPMRFLILELSRWNDLGLGLSDVLVVTLLYPGAVTVCRRRLASGDYRKSRLLILLVSGFDSDFLLGLGRAGRDVGGPRGHGRVGGDDDGARGFVGSLSPVGAAGQEHDQERE